MKTATRQSQSHSASAADSSVAEAESRAHARRIIATFQPQEVAAGKVVDSGAQLSLGVTDEVLSLTARQVRNLADNCQTTDDLAPYGMHLHNGVYRVEVCEAICRHFGVKDLRDIDEQRLVAARLEDAQWRLGVKKAAAVSAVAKHSSNSFDTSRLHPSPGARVAFHL